MRSLLLIIVLSTSVVAFPQVPPTAGGTVPVGAKSEDVASIESIVNALYDVISGPAGKKRDWGRMRSLFAPDGQMSVVSPTRSGGVGRRALTVDEYIKASGPFLEERGFFEKEASKRVERFASIAHVFSTYESRHKAEDPKPFQRGINSIQLWNDGKRWWIQTVMWQGEDAGNQLPAKYLAGG